MNARLVGVIPVLVCIVMLGRAADAWDLALVLGGLALLFTFLGPRWELDVGRQLVTSAMGAGAGYVAAVSLHEAHGLWLGEVFVRLTAALIAAATARFVIVGVGRLGSIVLLFPALMLCGETRVSGYPLAVGLFLLSSLWALHAYEPVLHTIGNTPHPEQRRKLKPQRVLLGSAMLLTCAVAAITATLSLRAVHSWLMNRGHSTAFQWHPRIGFSDRMDLGALDEMLDSDTIVLRVRGGHADYLRGAALDIYEAGRWMRSDEAGIERKLSLSADAKLAHPIEVTGLTDRTDRLFVPLRAAAIVAQPRTVLVDKLGSFKRPSKQGTSVVRFVEGARQQGIPGAPTRADLQVPRRLRPALTKLAEQWTVSIDDIPAALAELESRLQREYRYKRGVSHEGALDPIMDFLLVDRRGHCEYFATAMALLARSLGIPARVVTGYRVAEQTRFGYYVVRERNAHSWVEAFVPGRGWVTHDPTPEAFLPQNRVHEASLAASLVDALSVGYDAFTDWMAHLSVAQTAIGWFAALLILAWIVARGARRQRTELFDAADDQSPLPFLATLLAKLSRKGHVRPPHEPLERLASRLPEQSASHLLERYAALRYGDLGDARQLSKDVSEYVRDQR